VDGGHDAADDAAVLKHHLDYGARQLVVQLAFEITLCLAASVLVLVHAQHQALMSSLLAGAEMMTFFTSAQVRLGLVPSVKNPSDSTTISAPTEPNPACGVALRGDLIFLPSTTM